METGLLVLLGTLGSHGCVVTFTMTWSRRIRKKIKEGTEDWG